MWHRQTSLHHSRSNRTHSARRPYQGPYIRRLLRVSYANTRIRGGVGKSVDELLPYLPLHGFENSELAHNAGFKEEPEQSNKTASEHARGDLVVENKPNTISNGILASRSCSIIDRSTETARFRRDEEN